MISFTNRLAASKSIGFYLFLTVAVLGCSSLLGSLWGFAFLAGETSERMGAAVYNKVAEKSANITLALFVGFEVVISVYVTFRSCGKNRPWPARIASFVFALLLLSLVNFVVAYASLSNEEVGLMKVFRSAITNGISYAATKI